jgi:micrococcal nuclease
MIAVFSRGACVAFALVLCLVSCASHALAASSLRGRVTHIYDGDTIRVAGIGKVRLLGIDVPEKEASYRDRYLRQRGIAPDRLRRIHHRAHAYVRAKSLGRIVVLRTEPPTRDTYGRLLAYVTLPGGHMLNRLLLQQGLAAVYRRFDFSLKGDFIEKEEDARLAKRGMWQ